MRYAVGRKPVPAEIQRPTVGKSFPAPTRGWVTNQNLGMDGPMTARRMDNWIPETDVISVRGGTTLHATVHASNPVLSMWCFEASNDQLFAATDDSVFDITAPADPAATITADVTGRTDGYYSTQMFTSAGGSYQYCCNDADKPLLYDGANFTAIDGASTPAITGVTTTLLSAVWAHASRLWFVERDTMRAWYLAVDSIGGAATSFELTSVFRMGGSLLFGTTWSLDAGDGLDDKCVFVSSKGEVAVYQGTDPSSSTTWALVGVYYLGGATLGKIAFYHVGGEPHFLTERGIIPLNEAIRRDAASLAINAISAPIEPDWQELTENRYDSMWKAVLWPNRHLLLIAAPPNDVTDDDVVLVAHANTNAWSRWTGIDCNSLALMGQSAYCARSDGKIVLLDTGGTDYASGAYTAAVVFHFDHLGSPSAYKTVTQARALFRTGNDINYKISTSVDYTIALPAAPSSVAEFSAGDVWDTGLWDTAVWDAAGGNLQMFSTRWKSIGKSGYSHAMQVQITSGTSAKPHVEMVMLDVVYESGGLVV